MFDLLIQLVALGVLALAVAVLVVSLARRPIVLVYAVLAVHGWELLLDGVPSMRVAGIAVGPGEVVHLIAFGAGLLRLRRGPFAWQAGLLGALALVFYATLRGYVLHGDAAMLGFRAELYFLVPAFLVTTLPSSAVRGAITAVVRFGMLLAVVAIGRWIALALGLPWAASFTNTGYAVERVINAGATLAVAFSLVALLHRVARSDWRLSVRFRTATWVMVATGVAVMAQHRSVWVAVLVMLGLLFLRLPRRWYAKSAVILTVVTAVVWVEMAGLGYAGPITESLAQAATNTDTWEWRLARWDAVWATHAARGWEAIVFGSGYGYSWVSGEVGVWEASPHNGFLQVAVRLGVVGAVLVFGAYAFVLRVLARSGDRVGSVLWLWIVGTLVYFLSYSGSPLTGVVLGVALLRTRSMAGPATVADVHKDEGRSAPRAALLAYPAAD